MIVLRRKLFTDSIQEDKKDNSTRNGIIAGTGAALGGAFGTSLYNRNYVNKLHANNSDLINKRLDKYSADRRAGKLSNKDYRKIDKALHNRYNRRTEAIDKIYKTRNKIGMPIVAGVSALGAFGLTKALSKKKKDNITNDNI